MSVMEQRVYQSQELLEKVRLGGDDMMIAI